jgi:hypothetical protein
MYTAGGHDLRFFENPHPCPLPKGEGEKAAIRTRFEYSWSKPWQNTIIIGDKNNLKSPLIKHESHMSVRRDALLGGIPADHHPMRSGTNMRAGVQGFAHTPTAGFTVTFFSSK